MPTIKLKRFPTHIEKTDNKVKANKFWKINNQSIYNGAINKFSRAIVVKNLHNYVMDNLPNVKIEFFPVRISITIRTVKNHGSIQRRGGTVRWKKPKDDYNPTWDEDNLTAIWTKVIRDAIAKKGMIPDDNITYILGGYRGVEFVDDFDDREIIIKIEGV